MTRGELIQKLEQNRLMNSAEQVQAFEMALTELSKDPTVREVLHELFQVLDDRSEHYEVMFGLVHFLESFDLKSLLEAYVRALPRLAVRGLDWSEIMHKRILNHEQARTYYKTLLSTCNPTTRDLIHRLLVPLAVKKPQFRDRIESLLS